MEGNVMISVKMPTVYSLDIACPLLEIYPGNARAQMQNYTYTDYCGSIVCNSKNWEKLIKTGNID